MKRKVLSFLLVFVLAAGIAVPAVQAAVAASEDSMFGMAISADKTAGLQPGDTVVATVKAQPRPGAESFMSYQFTLTYPEDKLELVKVTPNSDFPKDGFVSNAKAGEVRVAYNAMRSEGLPMDQLGAELATAEFKVLPVAKAETASIWLSNGEVVRPNDSKGPAALGREPYVELSLKPVLGLSVQDGAASVTVAKGRSGTLVTAVYSGQGQMLDLQVADVTADQAPTIALDQLDLTGGALVKAFLLDQDSSPVCLGAELALPVK